MAGSRVKEQAHPRNVGAGAAERLRRMQEEGAEQQRRREWRAVHLACRPWRWRASHLLGVCSPFSLLLLPAFRPRFAWTVRAHSARDLVGRA
jgi:hypothetical protein